MAKFMVIEKGKELKGNEREARLKELEKIDEEKRKFFFEDEAEEDKNEKKSKKNMGGTMQKTYGMREGGFTKRGGMYKKGY
tara:strand:+ start:374 stop:616 length:243 start_codon:yes stop_codon:yes gene_type:complete